MKLLRTVLLALLVLNLSTACGGGGGDLASAGDEGGGISGTGLTSLGAISGFGSIFVNGIEFNTDNAEIIVNGVPSPEDALGVGMVVMVEGTVSDDGATGTAQRVVFDGVLRGPVAALRVTDAVDRIEFQVLDVAVVAARGATVFEGAAAGDITDNDYVEISGFFDTRGRLQATRVEQIADFVPGQSAVSRTGVISNLDGTSFTLGDLPVDAAAADLSALPGGVLGNDLRVLVTGTLEGGIVTAARLAPARDVRAALVTEQRLVIAGVVAEFDGATTFRVGDVPVDAEGAELELDEDALANGLLVEVAGRWNGETLRAVTVSSRRAEVLLAAPLASVDTERGTVTLDLFHTGITASVNALTLVSDDTGRADRLRLAALAVGDYVTVAAMQRGSTLHALQIHRGDGRASALRAQVERFTPGSRIVLRGIAIDTTQATLLDAAGMPLSVDGFYSRLQVGDTLLAIDTQVPDGAADTVRFVAPD